MKKLFVSPVVALLLIIASSSVWAGIADVLGQGEPKFLPVERAFPLSLEQNGQQISAHFDTQDGYYLYKKRLYVQDSQGKKHAPTFYSQQGKLKYDEAFGEVIVFYGPLDIHYDNLPAGDVTFAYQGCADAGLCYPPKRQTLHIDAQTKAAGKTHAKSSATSNAVTQRKATESTKPSNHDTSAFGSQDEINNSWFARHSSAAILGIFFVLGIGLTFTPCVLPMVPILTSVVLGGESNSPRRGFVLSTLYVLGMAITYAGLGVLVALAGAGANVQAWMQTPWVLSVFAALFIALALSMFGLYELQLPSGLRNRLERLNQKQQGGKGISVFLMGVLSALVVSPCVSAPLAGALVYISSTGDALLGGGALLALGLGMGAPLIALGTTGSSVLPKAGVWMERIKHFFGVLLLAVAITLLARFLPNVITLALIGILTVTYAVQLGAFEPASSAGARLLKGIAWILFIYGAASLLGALQGNSDPLMPLKSSQVLAQQQNDRTSSPFERLHSVEQLNARIAASDKPVMVDLYADWCISCIEMEHTLFNQRDVQSALSHLTWLQLDVTEQTPEQIEFMKRHHVFGPPSILFFAPNNDEYSDLRIIGETNKTTLIERAQRIR